MNHLKSIVKAGLAKDPLDIIFWGDPTTQTFNQAFLAYKSGTMQDKREIEQRAYRKLQKYKQPKIVLAILCLLDIILSNGYQINLEHLNATINIKQCRSQKQKVSELSFFKFYFSFLSKQSMRMPMPQQQGNQNFYLFIKDCQIAVQCICKVLNSDFIIEHSLIHSNHKLLTNIVVNKILTRVHSDLLILKNFVIKHCQKILQKHEYTFNINDIYEKCLFFSKQSQKLQKLKRKSGFKGTFEFYRIATQQNKQIQQQILSRQSEYRKFTSEKHIKFTSQAQKKEVLNSFATCPQIIFEDSILLMDEELI